MTTLPTSATSLTEVKAAARDLLAGMYRAEQSAWSPRPADSHLLILGCLGGAGATTVALAIATGTPSSRLIECCPAVDSGLVAAGYSELGEQMPGWQVSDRDHVRLEHRAPATHEPRELLAPMPGNGAPTRVIVDAGHGLDRVRRTPWLAHLLDAAPAVLVARGTIPGLRRLEAVLADLEPAEQVAAAVVVGRPRKRWPKELTYVLGPRSRGLDRQGALHALAEDSTLAYRGLDPAPLPPALRVLGRDLVTVLGWPAIPASTP